MSECVLGIDPRVLQGLLTLLASAVAAGAALWIAYFAYPRQKKIDRRYAIQAESRASYAKFSSEISELFRCVEKNELSDFLKNAGKCRGLYANVLMFAPTSTAEACRDVFNSVNSLHNMKRALKSNEDAKTKSELEAQIKDQIVDFRTRYRDLIAHFRAEVDEISPLEARASVLLYQQWDKKDDGQ